MRVEVSAAEPAELAVDILGVPVADPPDASRLDARLRAKLERLSGINDGHAELLTAVDRWLSSLDQEKER